MIFVNEERLGESAHVESVDICVIIAQREMEWLLGVPGETLRLVHEDGLVEGLVGPQVVEHHRPIRAHTPQDVTLAGTVLRLENLVCSPLQLPHRLRSVVVPDLDDLSRAAELVAFHTVAHVVQHRLAHPTILALLFPTPVHITIITIFYLPIIIIAIIVILIIALYVQRMAKVVIVDELVETGAEEALARVAEGESLDEVMRVDIEQTLPQRHVPKSKLPVERATHQMTQIHRTFAQNAYPITMSTQTSQKRLRKYLLDLARY